jgi:pyrimidine operon attenuation protein/uracil phosphoribosyltransferase
VKGTDVYKSAEAIGDVIARMTGELKGLFGKRGVTDPLLVGIHTGGVWIAESLHRSLGLADPLGRLDISFYRDDFTRIGMHPEVRPSDLPVAVDDRHIVLVDDVLQTGRTIRAALNVLFDYGRPASVMLAVLVKRDGRELPVEPDVTGLELDLEWDRQIKLMGPSPLELVLVQTPEGRAKKG